MLTMQDALLALTRYWTEQGCLVVQPMNTEVGAGTLNPATALRVLGPEPWRVVYVEPSVRPDDARYGENPNRLQAHTQVQVILKPEPGNPQELYLGSLAALGIDVNAHDVRFVEDNWASPALGAWGLGWEVWLDGLEITQFTYFQQSGGLTLDPVSVEITYGMERIIMALQGVSHFKDIAYAPGISYGEAFGQAEYEMSRYYLDDADITANRELLDLYTAEARKMIDQRLPVPAHSYVLKCSHAFNVLDARGAISTTERAQAFATMRGLANQVAKLWTQRREELGHPLGTTPNIVTPAPGAPITQRTSPAPFVLEVGVEELPPAETGRAAKALAASVAEKLSATRLDHGAITSHATPRRLIVTIADVAAREADHQRTVRGPRLSAAYGPDGEPTKAAQGFARGHHLDVADLQRIDVGGVTHVGFTEQVPGRPAVDVLASLLPQAIGGLRAEKNMRWNAPGLVFSRPIRWVLALLGEDIVPFNLPLLPSGRTTRVHRTAQPPTADVPTAEDYLGFLKRHGIIADAKQRQEMILTEAADLATRAGGRINPEPGLVSEITNLIEYPTPILGSFDPSYLDLPPQILVTVMRKHQRYLPVYDNDGHLMPHFVAVANGTCDHDAVRAGNEAVLRARYEDAAFFYRHDLDTPLETMKAKLEALTFETRLGSMAGRADRISTLATHFAERVGLSRDEATTLDRAGHLIKFDLGSQMVTELTSLAGIMAREYAVHAGETPDVATALYEAELPRTASGELPTTTPGAILALADRFDLLAGLFAIGSEPTGSSDPYGLRRAALGIINILRAHPRLSAITLTEGLTLATDGQPIHDTPGSATAAYDFTLRRFEQLLTEQRHPAALIRAVLPLADAPARAEATLTELATLIRDKAFIALAAALQRVRRILPADAPSTYSPDRFDNPAEGALHNAADKLRATLGDSYTLDQFTTAGQVLIDPVNTFFTDVMVMADDPAVRTNRLGLLATVYGLAARVLAWEHLNL